MGKYGDRVANHPVNGSITSTLAALESMTDEQVGPVSDDKDRLEWVVRHLRDRLAQAPAAAVGQSLLDQCNAQLGSVGTEIASYRDTGDATAMTTANTQADSILDVIRALPPLPPKGQIRSLSDEVAGVRSSIETLLKLARDESSALATANKSAREAVTAATEELTAQVETLSTRLQSVTDDLTSKEAEVQTLVETQTAAFQTAENKRAQSFVDTENGREKSAGDALKAAAETAKSQRDQIEQNAKSLMRRLDELETQAKNVVGGIGVLGVAAVYHESADDEAKSAHWWRIATIVSAVLAAAILVSALFIEHGQSGTWSRIASRVAVSLAFGGLAGWCGKQAAGHRSAARDDGERYRQLAALDAYLANTDPDAAQKVKLALAGGYFVPRDVDGGARAVDDGQPTGPAWFIQAIQAVTQLLKKSDSPA